MLVGKKNDSASDGDSHEEELLYVQNLGGGGQGCR